MKNTQKRLQNFCKGDLTFIEHVIKDVYMKLLQGMKLDYIFMNPNRNLKIEYGLLNTKRLTVANRGKTTRNIYVLYAIASNFNLIVAQNFNRSTNILPDQKSEMRGVNLLQDVVPAHTAN